MKKIVLLFSLLWFQQKLFAQTIENVGINTYTPDPSAALDVQATNKGVLLPRVFLQSETDGTTVLNPAHGLVLYNTNDDLPNKVGVYFNSGTVSSPIWKNLEENLALPYSQVANNLGPLFSVQNQATTVSVAAIGAYSDAGQGISGISSNGTAVLGTSSQSGTGVFASSLSGLSMKVDGKVKIEGGNLQPGPGKVLTSDVSGNATWETPINEFDNTFNGFQASGILGGGSQNMSESSFVKIAFANQSYDWGGNYNDVNMAPHSSFNAPKKGIYHFDVMARWEKQDMEGSFGPTMKLVRIRGGVTTELSENRAWAPNGYYTSHIAVDCELLPGDVVNVVARAYGSNVALGVAERDAHFNGHLAIELNN